MRQALTYAVDLEIIDSNVFSQVKVDGRRMFRKEKKKDSQTQVFSVEEVSAIESLIWKDVENPAHSRTHILAPLGVLFMLKTGVGVGEMLAVKHDDISEDGTLMDGKVNLNSIREFVGHTDERTTLNCYCFDRSNKEERLANVEEALKL